MTSKKSTAVTIAAMILIAVIVTAWSIVGYKNGWEAKDIAYVVMAALGYLGGQLAGSKE